MYVATFVRGLAWQWHGILTAQPATAPVVANAPRGAISSSRQGAAPNPNPANAAPQPPRVALARTDVPAPRNATDDRGVTYDADGVAVMGIDADPTGVYNVPAGRQLRIGGPTGQLFDVQDGGKLAPAKFNDDSDDDDVSPFPGNNQQRNAQMERAHDSLQNIGAANGAMNMNMNTEE
ncbi:MAG: hypothetical protein EBZ89_05575, partial [Chloroflexi bacterium]|nr:hypothetical protein [Chloroflexota bacterium]